MLLALGLLMFAAFMAKTRAEFQARKCANGNHKWKVQDGKLVCEGCQRATHFIPHH